MIVVEQEKNVHRTAYSSTGLVMYIYWLGYE